MSASSNARTQAWTRGLPWIVAAGLAVLLAATQLPGFARSATDEPLPTVVFVARSDNPVDALAASSVAGTMGGTVLLTSTNELSPVTRQALLDLNPDLVVLAGGTGALSATVEQQIQAIPLETRRVSGPTRIDTAAAIGELAAELGFGRPVVTGATVHGDAGLAGTLSVGALEVESDEKVDNLNASTLDGRTAEDLTPRTSRTFEFTIAAADWGNNAHYGSNNIFRAYTIAPDDVGGEDAGTFFRDGGTIVTYVNAHHEGGGSLGGWHTLPYLYRSVDDIGIKVLHLASRGEMAITQTTNGWDHISINEAHLPDELEVRMVFIESE